MSSHLDLYSSTSSGVSGVTYTFYEDMRASPYVFRQQLTPPRVDWRVPTGMGLRTPSTGLRLPDFDQRGVDHS